MPRTRSQRPRAACRGHPPLPTPPAFFGTATREAIDELLDHGRRPVFHLSVHSFTPTLDGEVREAEIGLLYDPARPREVRWANAWADALTTCAPEWRIRHNYPYLGTDDGHATQLRTQVAVEVYAGIELEVNQALLGSAAQCATVAERLRHTLWVGVAVAAGRRD